MTEKQKAAVERVAGQRYWRGSEARVVVDAWRASGEGLAGFARRYGIQPRRVSRWARELEERGEPVRFHPVRLVGEAEIGRRSEESRIEIELGDGATVRVPAGFAAEDLARVLEVLASETTGAAC